MQKSDETRRKILTAALALFRTQGFEKSTMREVAQRAGVATGAAYYYFDSKDALVLAFYEQAAEELGPLARKAAEPVKGLAAKLREVVIVKIAYFAENRDVLRALLRTGADPKHPLSPFSRQTKLIRDADIEIFSEIVRNSGVSVPKDLAPFVPEVLWMYQMGVIYFWLTDESEGQSRSRKLIDISAKTVAGLLELASLPLTKTLRKPVVEMMHILLEKNA
ncbi:MAG TPA: TetR/AcrR family transcriptional regulator [Bryobacteraceae bacterium]|jgi:AcrR family transcriptional regulator